MNKLTGIRTVATLWLALAATGAQATETAAQQCVTPTEASGLLMALAPDALKAVGKTCTDMLPSTALLRQTSGPFIEKYQAEADRSWPAAKSAFVKIAGSHDGAALGRLSTNEFRAAVTAILVTKLGSGIKAKDCVLVERILSSLEPLPPHNLADLFVTIIQAADADKVRKGVKRDIDICPAGAP